MQVLSSNTGSVDLRRVLSGCPGPRVTRLALIVPQLGLMCLVWL